MAVDKLVDSTQLDTDLTAVANAIRAKGGTSAQLAFPSEFVSAINAISGSTPAALPCVKGTFNYQSGSQAKDITLDYNGTGYPVAVLIYPTEGPYNSASGSFYSLVRRYATAFYLALKLRADATPYYYGSVNVDFDAAYVYIRYKSSSSDATAYSTSTSVSSPIYDHTAATDIIQVKIQSATSMSVYVATSSMGFAKGIEYTYFVLYSS